MDFKADQETEKRVEEVMLKHQLRHPSRNEELREEGKHTIEVSLKYLNQLLHAPDMDVDVRAALLLQTKEVLKGYYDFLSIE